MSGKLGFGLALVTLAALLGGWFLLSRQVDRLDTALGRQLVRVEELDAAVGDANSRIDESYGRIEQARTLQEAASSRLDLAASGAVVAERERLEAETQSAEAQQLERKALEKAAEARRREQQERRKREEEWARLERALGTIAPTTRYGWTLTVDLPAGLASDKEKISRLAGVLLAHHGYRGTVEGQGSAAVEGYLGEAGIPAEVLSRGATRGRLRLSLQDRILGQSDESR